MRAVLLLSALALTQPACATAGQATQEGPNWRPRSVPTEQVRDTRAPQWRDVPLGEDLIAPSDVKLEPQAKGATPAPPADPKPADPKPADPKPADPKPAEAEPAGAATPEPAPADGAAPADGR